MTTQNWPQDPLVPSTTGTESSTSDLGAHELGTTGSAGGNSGSKTSAAKHQAQQVGQEGKEAAKNVAGTAASEAKSVAAEAGSQAKNLLGTVTSEVKSQAGTQQQKITQGIRSISDELKSIAEKSDNHVVSSVVQQASQRTDSAASWLESRDAADILEDVKAFARRKPGAFLAIAAGSGLVVGRLTRGFTGNRESGTTSGSARNFASTDTATTGTYPGYTETGSDLYSGTPATAGFGETTHGQHVAGSNPAFVDPTDDYPTIPPGTPPVGTLPNDGSLR
ncbi:hypothetical protein [Arthrobacter sedimenti]|uniref:hypothetical protein n=1 Tax=Arthrobacter sedimenti TaxID=2694931 RepID=UPI000B35D00C|nr:hypothetical protein [Arthrobacter sedimenti]OUM44927.1 hypothetical protein B8W73_02065 [Arthrobacter agilis]